MNGAADVTMRYSSGSDRRERTVPSVLNGQSVLFYHYRFCFESALYYIGVRASAADATASTN